MSGIFGGKKSKSVSDNKAYDSINQNFGGLQGMAGTGANALQSLLSGDASGFNKYKDATGFDFAADQGSRGITGNAAAGGLLRSGSTGKSLVSFGNNLQQQFAGNYMDRLMGQADMGFKAGGLLSQAGQQTKQSSREKPGIGGFLGQIGGGIAASDRRLKKDLVKIGSLGKLDLFQYEYTNVPGVQVGVMAQDVAEHYPKALGPTFAGYMTVDYDALREEVFNEPS